MCCSTKDLSRDHTVFSCAVLQSYRTVWTSRDRSRATSVNFTVNCFLWHFKNTHFIWRECITLSTTKINILTHNICSYKYYENIYFFLSKFYLTKYAFQINHKQWSPTSFIALVVPSLCLFLWLVVKVLAKNFPLREKRQLYWSAERL